MPAHSFDICEVIEFARDKMRGYSPSFERQRGRSAFPIELTTSALHVEMSHRVFDLVTTNSMLSYQLLVEFVKTVFEHQALVRPVDFVRFRFQVVADSSYKHVLCGLHYAKLTHKQRSDAKNGGNMGLRRFRGS